MATKRTRDYKAEYARRKQREIQRAKAEGRAPSLHRARGHVSREHERAQRIARKTIASRNRAEDLVEAARWGVDPDLWLASIEQIRDEKGEAFLQRRLREKIVANVEYVEARKMGQKPDAAARTSSGYDQFHGPYMSQFSWLPIEAWFYHGGQD